MKIEDLLCGKVIAVVVFITMTTTVIYLSHQNGKIPEQQVDHYPLVYTLARRCSALVRT